MDSLLQGMMGSFSEDIIKKVSEQAGVDPTMAKQVLEKMTPAITGALAKNTHTEGGAEKLAEILDTKHDGSVLSNPESLNQQELETDGSKILGHIFGDQTTEIEKELESQTGADEGTTKKMMATFAPLVLGALGQQKKELGLDTAGLSSVLDIATTMFSQEGSKADVLKNMMDLDKDGQVVDDLPKLIGYLGIAKNFFGKKG